MKGPGHAGEGPASPSHEGHIPTESGCLPHTWPATGEFDLVDVEFDDVEMLSNGFGELQKPALGDLSLASDDLIQVLLKAKILSQPRTWTFVQYTPEEIATWGSDCYSNEINFERHNYWYPNRLTLPTLDDQVLDLLPKLENGSLTSESNKSLGLSEFSIDLDGIPLAANDEVVGGQEAEHGTTGMGPRAPAYVPKGTFKKPGMETFL